MLRDTERLSIVNKKENISLMFEGMVITQDGAGIDVIFTLWGRLLNSLLLE